MKDNYQVGDIVLVRKIFGGFFHAQIDTICQGLFGIYYLARWRVMGDFGEYDKIGILHNFNIIKRAN